MPERGEDLLQSRRHKLTRLRQKGVDPYPPRFARTATTQQAAQLFLEHENRQGTAVRTASVSVAGRITALRSMGRATFADLRDGSGKLQVHLRRDLLGDAYELVKELDLGDFLGVTGPLFRTRTSEVTVEATSFAILAKALRPPPEKWHGLKDVEQRYRQRYLDLVANPEVMDVFVLRSQTINAIRTFLSGRGFVEVDTPVLVPVPAGAMARPFVTHHHALDEDLYLRIALELYLKRLIVGGFDKVYEIGRVFRNEGIDQDHNPEFTLLESYEAYADYNAVMEMVEQMVSTVSRQVVGTTTASFCGQAIELSPPWRRISFRDAVLEHTGIDIDRYVREERPLEGLLAEARSKGLDVGNVPSFRLYDKLLSLAVEPKLVQPTFVLDYPKDMSPLAKDKPGCPGYVERFEAFAGGMELANSFTELNDPDEQRLRLQRQEEWRKRLGDEETERLDEDFLLALEYGMPPTGGLGMGIDRLVMLLSGQPTMRDVVLFPQLRHRGA